VVANPSSSSELESEIPGPLPESSFFFCATISTLLSFSAAGAAVATAADPPVFTRCRPGGGGALTGALTGALVENASSSELEPLPEPELEEDPLPLEEPDMVAQ
jgi:hypothetical protein